MVILLKYLETPGEIDGSKTEKPENFRLFLIYLLLYTNHNDNTFITVFCYKVIINM